MSIVKEEEEEEEEELDKTTKEYKVAVSWVVHCIKNVMGYDDVRKSVLKYLIPDIQNLSYSATFSGLEEDYQNIITKYILNKATKKSPYVVFTTANPSSEDKEFPETHYQFFYVDNVNHVIYSIDPASVYNPKTGKVKRGVWEPIASEGMINYLKKNTIDGHRYTLEYVKTSHPAQTSQNDVFCQTWSLLLMVEFIKQTHTTPPSPAGYRQIVIDVPEDERVRYQKIIDFYHLVTDIPVLGGKPREKICDILTTEYQQELANHQSMIVGDLSTTMYNKLMKMNPCLIMKHLTVDDIYDW